ncbi:hypothetical protein ACSAZL_07575 [Methanosarcina sp. T3]|uniref:hypothetical protein n=1 Tax=Methanosarcina sp. T3 TaxID=3439062 RepID=UPI003F85EEAF
MNNLLFRETILDSNPISSLTTAPKPILSFLSSYVVSRAVGFPSASFHGNGRSMSLTITLFMTVSSSRRIRM